MSRKTVGQICMAVGLLAAALSLAADWIGLGSYPGIHLPQASGIVMGLVVAVLGFGLQRGRSGG